MKIVFVSSEMVPYAKTGGLADVTGALAAAFRKLGHEVHAFLPCYKSINPEALGFQVAVGALPLYLGGQQEKAKVFSKTDSAGVKVYLVQHEGFFGRDYLYGTPYGDFPDNDRRFIFFQRAVLDTLSELNIHPDIIHCHDWQAALIPVYLKTLYSPMSVFKKTRSVYTVHNLAYQGNFPPDSFPLTGLDWELFNLDKMEFYGKFSFMKTGLVFSDLLTTVSGRYAQEIQTKEFGCGLEGVLAKRKDHLFGIINGIDAEEWNPQKDKAIPAPFSSSHLEGKAQAKALLQKENEFRIDPKAPLIGIVSRLVDQKGLDILIPVLPEMARQGIQLVVLGTGEEKYHQIFREIAKKNRSQFGIHILFDSDMARRIYAGSDIMLFPSYYEPCGLGQLIALRYGTIPIGRITGGLADTIEDFNAHSLKGNGFLFSEYSSEAFLNCLNRAIGFYKEGRVWPALIKNAMASDFSWDHSARKYIQLYEQVWLKKSKH